MIHTDKKHIVIVIATTIANIKAAVAAEYKNILGSALPKDFETIIAKNDFYYVGDFYNYYFGLQAKELVHAIGATPHFYNDVSLISGAKEALECLDAVYHVELSCIDGDRQEAWVHSNLGEKWVKRLVYKPPSDIIDADIIVDDNPNLVRPQGAVWKQILFAQPYNEGSLRPRVCWTDADYMAIVAKTIEKAQQERGIDSVIRADLK